jgi:hypothetical protein
MCKGGGVRGEQSTLRGSLGTLEATRRIRDDTLRLVELQSSKRSGVCVSGVFTLVARVFTLTRESPWCHFSQSGVFERIAVWKRVLGAKTGVYPKARSKNGQSWDRPEFAWLLSESLLLQIRISQRQIRCRLKSPVHRSSRSRQPPAIALLPGSAILPASWAFFRVGSLAPVRHIHLRLPARNLSLRRCLQKAPGKLLVLR